MAAEVRPSGNALEVTNRERIAMLLRTDAFDVAPDGKSVLTMQESDNRVQIFVTTNWLPQLRARLAGHR